MKNTVNPEYFEDNVTVSDKVEQVYESYVNGQFKQAYGMIDEIGEYVFFPALCDSEYCTTKEYVKINNKYCEYKLN